MNLHLKNIKFSQFASQETYCYQASLFLDNKKIAQVSNSGQGGSDCQDFVNREVERIVNNYYRSLPKKIITMSKSGHGVFGEPFEVSESLEGFCNDSVFEWLLLREAKKLLKKFHYIRKSDMEIRTITGKHIVNAALIANVKKSKWWSDDCVCLNELELDEVIKYMKA